MPAHNEILSSKTELRQLGQTTIKKREFASRRQVTFVATVDSYHNGWALAASACASNKDRDTNQTSEMSRLLYLYHMWLGPRADQRLQQEITLVQKFLANLKKLQSDEISVSIHLSTNVKNFTKGTGRSFLRDSCGFPHKNTWANPVSEAPLRGIFMSTRYRGPSL